MPKNDTWPGAVAMESLSSRDSAGSCDSVISVNSTCSEDSMEHLSAEERACLMYLEETIEALEVQEDSGLSNDEPDHDISRYRCESVRNEDQQFSTVSAANGHDAKSASLDLMSRRIRSLSKSDTGSKTTSSATQAKMLRVSMDGDGKPKIVTCDKIKKGLSTEATDLDLIPPPSDFMDDPDSPSVLNPSLGESTSKPAETIDLELVKRASLSPSVTKESVNKSPPEVPLSLCQHEAAEPKSPPIVAPKPKKLPANIILKSQKVSAPSEGNSGPTMLLDPQRVRIEALRKLGLLKSEEVEPVPSPSPKHSPKTRKSWSAPPHEVNLAAPHTPPLTPSSVHVSSPAPASAPSQSPAAVPPSANSTAPPAHLLPDILPAPAAFSDLVKPLVNNDSPTPVDAAMNTSPLTPPSLTPPRVTGIKSATLEHSGLSLSTYMAALDSSEFSQGVSGEEDPAQPCNSRLRPASLRSRKEGQGLEKRRASSKEPGSQRSPSAHTAFQPGESQKLPRSQGISVLICPRAENGEDRRNALKKLGLLRD